ncbi:mitochondrial intermediate peptidase-like [Saccostrea echinata]|uniref:mitochondrial intermediate peptidase-like n=1 Tax=Saccostrea echinata TaxID=191078 RepID=UPI002A81BA00|nr:mitochondrial intermediate peptidase-like [Saccostrea echinata]
MRLLHKRSLALLRAFGGARKYVSTLSPLGSVFNSIPTPKKSEWFFSNKENKGLLLIPELKSFQGFDILRREVEYKVETLVEEALSPQRKRKIVTIFDEISNTLCCVADLAEFVRVSHPNRDYQLAAEYAVVNLSNVVESLNTNTAIYNVLKEALEKGEDVLPMNAVDKRVGELFKFDFDLSGCHLSEDKKKKYVKLSENVIMTGNMFMQGCQSSAIIPKDRLPEHLRYCFNLDGDDAVISGAHLDNWNDQVREAAYRVYHYPNESQVKLLDALILNRHKLATLAGFPTFAHRALKGTLAETPEMVMDFLNALSERIKPLADKEHKELLKLKRERGSTSDVVLRPWDTPYYSALGRHLKYDISGDEIAPYFSLGNCMEGINIVLKSLYDVSLQTVEPQYGELWSDDVYKLAAVHSTEGVLGYIYCDLFERQGKHMMDCHCTIRGGREQDDGTYQLPIVVLNCNLTRPQNNAPTLLTPGLMRNLFHEFGHAMHSMLGRTKYQHVTGTRCPTDFAEVPSEFMEFFATDPRVISLFARHFRTGELLPLDAIEKFCKASNMFSASEMQLQIVYSMLSQKLHGEHPLGKSTTELYAEIHNQYMGVPYVEGTAPHLRIGHLNGYGARYYSYLMSRAVASKIWQQCFKEDPLNREVGERFRREVLAYGGEIPPQELISGMLQKPLTIDDMVDSLVEEMNS